MANRAVDPSTLSVMTRWRIVLMLMGFAALGHFNRLSIAVAGGEVFIPKVGISETRMGWVYTTFLIIYTIGMLPGGWLIDRLGSARVMTLYGVSMGTFVALTGVLGWTTSTPEGLWLGLLLIRGLAGFCNAPLHPGAAHVVADLMSVNRRASANGMVTAGALIGVALVFPVFGWMMDRLNWPLAFVVTGCALVAYGLIWRFIATPLLPGPHVAVTPTEHMSWTGMVKLLSQGNLWLVTLSYAAFGYFQYLFFYWMAYYFKEILHVSALESRQASFYITLAQGAGMAIGGLSTDMICHFLGTIRGRRSIVLTGMGLSAVFGLAAINVEGLWSVAICLSISMAALGICEGVFWTTATDIGGKARGFSGAFMNTGGNIGGLISPVLTPVIAQQLGWTGAITVACAISALGGLVWFLIKPSGGRQTFHADAA